MTPHPKDDGRPARRLAAVVAALGAMLVLGASTAAASPGSLRIVDTAGPSYGRSIPIAAPGGGTFTTVPERRMVVLTSSDGTQIRSAAWCVDLTRRVDEGVDYPVDVQTPADTPALASPGMQAAGWLMGVADGLIAAAPDQGREAAAIQVAIWRLIGEAADVRLVTPDAALNARADELRWQAAGMAPVTALALRGPAAPAAVGSPAQLIVSGTPHAVVDLVVSSGAATLTGTRVAIGASGSATVDVTPTAPGTVVVNASARGGALVRAAHLAGARSPQDMALLLPAPLAASVTLTATTPAPAPPAVAPTFVAPASVAQTPAVLRLRKAAPARVRFGRRIDYTLTVTNTGTVTARAVVVRDPVPAGATVRRLPAAGRLEGGAVVWRLGDLAPGEDATVHLVLIAGVPSARGIVNIGAASASNAVTVRARALTRVTLPRRVAPARLPVTG